MGENVVISIIDDDESLRKAIKRLLHSVGLDVEDFVTAEEFLRSGGPHDSDCLILYVQLPGMSGPGASETTGYRQSPNSDHFITARCNEEARASAIEAGAVEFLENRSARKRSLVPSTFLRKESDRCFRSCEPTRYA